MLSTGMKLIVVIWVRFDKESFDLNTTMGFYEMPLFHLFRFFLGLLILMGGLMVMIYHFF